MSAIFEKTGIDIGLIMILLIMIIGIMMLMVVSMTLQLKRIEQKYRIFMKGKDGQSLEKLFAGKMKEIDRIAKQNELNQNNINDLKKIQRKTLNHYGIVKYDAFDDMGGKLSFALAMLDRDNTGFILNAIHSSDNCFLYIKEIVKGESYVMLSEEEVKALRQAVAMEEDTDL